MLKGEKRHFRELAEYVKKEFDTRFPGTWHVIAGIINFLVIQYVHEDYTQTMIEHRILLISAVCIMTIFNLLNFWNYC